MVGVHIQISPPIGSEQLNNLFATAWENHKPRDFQPIISRSLLYVCAYDDQRLVGYVNMAWDGGNHAFLLDSTVHGDYQRQGIGIRLVRAAVTAARERDIEWVHVDYEPHLDAFYRQCGFHSTQAGLINLLNG